MALLQGGLYRKLCGRRSGEIVRHLGFEVRLVALEGEHVVGLVGGDLVGDADLAAHGVDGHQRTFELACPREFVEHVRDGGDLVGFFRHAELGEDEPRRGRIGAERVQGLEPLAAVMSASGGLV